MERLAQERHHPSSLGYSCCRHPECILNSRHPIPRQSGRKPSLLKRRHVKLLLTFYNPARAVAHIVQLGLASGLAWIIRIKKFDLHARLGERRGLPSRRIGPSARPSAKVLRAGVPQHHALAGRVELLIEQPVSDAVRDHLLSFNRPTCHIEQVTYWKVHGQEDAIHSLAPVAPAGDGIPLVGIGASRCKLYPASQTQSKRFDPNIHNAYILESAEEFRDNVQKHAFGCGLVGIIQRLALPCA
jgi:hypothetical protein